MSFAAEMRDFFSGFQATSSAAGKIRDRLDNRMNSPQAFMPGGNFKAHDISGTFGPGSGKKTNTSVPPGEIKKIIDANVPEEMRGYAYRMAQKESAFNPKAVSRTGAAGLFQFTSGTWTDMTKQSIGVHSDGRMDPTANTQAFVKLTERNKDYLTKVLGREPTYGELAIAHQQGPGGAAYLITGRAPKGVDASQVEKNLAHNNIKAKGIDAAKRIAGYYGFDLGDMSTVSQGAIPDVPVAEYTPPQVGDSDFADVNPDIQYKRSVSQSSDDGSDQQADLLSGSRDAMNDIAAIDIPEGAKLYSPGDLTQMAGTMYGAEGGSVPWAGQVSQLAKSEAAIPVWRPKQTYGPLADLPDVADDPKPKKDPRDQIFGGAKDGRGNTYGTIGAGKPAGMTQAAWNEVVANGGYPKPPNSFGQNSEWHGSGVNANADYVMGGGGKNNEWHGYGVNTDYVLGSGGKSNEWHGTNNPGQFTSAIGLKNGGAGRNIISSKPGVPALAPKKGMPKKMFAAGGAVDEASAEEVAVHEAEALPTSAGAVTPTSYRQPTAPQPVPGRANRDTLAMDERPRPDSGGVSIGNAIDLGLKHLTRSLGLDRENAAVGPDPDYRNKQRKLVNGAIGQNEGPPTSQEVQQIYNTVDPDNQLNEGLKLVYALQKGTEYWISRGEFDKAGKWAGGLIQYANLLSRRYGYEAVQAGKNGDEDGMVKYAIKAYDAVPDGLNADVQKGDGGYQVTRTNEDGEVVDQHMLSPQQIFQMATGISTGSGYFEALMDVAEPGTSSQRAKEKQAKARAGNLDKLLPDIKGDMDPGELDAWSSAVEDGDYETLNKILGNVQTRRREKAKDEDYDKRQADIDRRIREAQEATAANLDKRLEASEGRQQKAIDAADERATKRDEARDAADLKKRERRVKGKVKLRSDYEPDMTASEKEQWDAAVEENDPEALDDIMANVDKRRDNKRSDERTANQNKAIDDRQTRALSAQEQKDLDKRKRRAGTLNELYDAYAPQMTAGQKRAWQKAFQDSDPETLQVIINSIDRSFGAPMPGEGEDTGGEGAIPTAPQAPALTTSAEAAPVTSGGKPFPAGDMAKVNTAIKAANGDPKKIEAIKQRARDYAKKNGFSTEGL